MPMLPFHEFILIIVFAPKPRTPPVSDQRVLADIYVALDGDDTINNGSYVSPFRTITHVSQLSAVCGAISPELSTLLGY